MRRDLLVDVTKSIRSCGHVVPALSPGGIAVVCRGAVDAPYRDMDLAALPRTVEDAVFSARKRLGEDVQPPVRRVIRRARRR